jgi:hypothetical protein
VIAVLSASIGESVSSTEEEEEEEAAVVAVAVAVRDDGDLKT